MNQPQALELEAAILGACFLEKQAMPLVADLLRPEMFYDNRCQLLFSALKSMYLCIAPESASTSSPCARR